MFQRKPVHDVKRVVWRMSESNPSVPAAPAGSPLPRVPGAQEVHDRWFRVSSLELAQGAEVTETDLGQLADEFAEAFGKRR